MEGLEQCPLGVRGNTWPRILDRELQAIPFLLRSTHRHASGASELQGIRHEVEKDALQLDRMTQATVRLGRDEVDLQPFLNSQRTDDILHLGQEPHD